MNLDALVGGYKETGFWKDSIGSSGLLSGSLTILYAEGCLEIAYEGGSRQVSAPIESFDHPIELSGTLGNGRLLVGTSSLILEYEADVAGRIEHNTDTWVIVDDGFFRRAGVIRQADRTIWFEAEMRKDGGT